MSGYCFKESLKLLNSDKWPSLSVEEKVAVLQSVENEMAVQSERHPCSVNAIPIDSKDDKYIEFGNYSFLSKNININSNQLEHGSKYGDNYGEHLDTILHEGRHAYQDQAVNELIQHNNLSEVEKWRENMKPEHYIEYEQNPKAYFHQPIEKDAFSFASNMAEEIEKQKAALNKDNLKSQYTEAQKAMVDAEAKRKDYILQQQNIDGQTKSKFGCKNDRLTNSSRKR